MCFIVLFLAGFSPNPRRIIAHHQQNKERREMRLKLVIIASVLAAAIGAGATIALVLGVLAVKSLSNPGLLATSTLLLPIAAIIFASIFVYRHTARRRRLQAFLTALLATLLTLSIFMLTSVLTSPTAPQEPLRPGPHVAS
jgi:hypothetical protein